MVKNCFTILFLVSNVAGAADEMVSPEFNLVHTSTLFKQSFESFDTRQWRVKNLMLIQDDINYLSPGNGNAHVRVAYVPTKKGSARVVTNIHLKKPAHRAQLSYKVKFAEAFEFVRSGKLHGLGGGELTTGCREQTKSGWSVRVAWLKGGVPVLYVYDQNRINRCGTVYHNRTGVAFEPGKWHTVMLDITLNRNAQSKDGSAVLMVDGIELIRIEGLQLTGTNDVLIDTFMFNTFHGGNTPAWSPSRTVFAEFDDFEVIEVSELN